MKITSKIERSVLTIDEHRTVQEAAVLMNEKFVGSVVVTGSTGIRGLFTERDLMRVVGEKRDSSRVKLKDAISADVVKVNPDETSSHCLDLMKEHRCRHLLVIDGSEFIGIVSLRDMVALMIEEKENLIGQLKSYITGA
ncbi:MAG: CBS domain-containing protein [Mariprofundaceae bacterium]